MLGVGKRCSLYGCIRVVCVAIPYSVSEAPWVYYGLASDSVSTVKKDAKN